MNVRSLGCGLLVAAMLVSVPSPLLSVASAATPDAACAADSLYLISPEMLDLRLESTGKRGVIVSWPNLDQSEATCFSLDGADTLAFGVSVAGGFGDEVDRLIGFSTENAGVVGAPNPGNITMSWQTLGGTANGVLSGQINLTNNGGLWLQSQGEWQQQNNGLPMVWPRTNVLDLARGSGGFMLGGFSGGISPTSDARGLFAYNGTNWERLAVDIFDDDLLVTKVAVSPTNNDHFAVGTEGEGVFVTRDGGQTFTQWTDNLNPQAIDAPTNFVVKVLNWDADRLFVFMPNWGLFVSEDGGDSFADVTFTVPANLDAANPEQDPASISDLAVDASNADHLVAALQFHGAYESDDGGVTWHDLNGDLVVPVPDEPGAWVNSGLAVSISPNDPQVIVMGVSQKGLFRTADGGVTWTEVGSVQQPVNLAMLIEIDLLNRPGRPSELLAMEDGWKLLHSLDFGANWSDFSPQPVPTKALVLAGIDGSDGDFIMGSNGGGIYEAGMSVRLADTYGSGTTAELRDLDLGLSISFDTTNGGLVKPFDSFELVAQTFQGWAVWRGPGHDPKDMKLLGLFDRVNPEDCFEGYCGDNSLEVIPLCFAAKRAACFDLSDPDTLRFFDSEVYNGFSYVYSVTTFDYGNTALVAAQNNTNEMLHSPRYDGDKLSRFVGSGNRTRIDLNEPATGAEHGDEIYAYPNPIRLGAGVPRGEGRLVVFTNLPDGSRVRIFTTAGDDVINLGPDNQTAGQMYWRTVNRNGEDVSAGVYLYKVEMPQREDYWGRIIVIR